MTLNKTFSLILGIISTVFSLKTVADDTVMSDKFVVSQSVHDSFRERVYVNPAARFFNNSYSLTSIHFNGVGSNMSEHKIAQVGKGKDFWGLEAKSQYIIDNDNFVWGEASYNNGKREDVRWNETSDFSLLYPYVMADEKGGNLKYEQYYFDGGYAGRYRRWTFGAALRYRALDEFRTRDPRPNNVVADLNAKIGAGYILGKYSVNLGLYAGKYKQTNELKYFNETGAAKEYHLTGLGNEFVRFSGACNNVFYKGHNFGASFELIPVNHDGFSLSVNYNRFSFDKILSNLNKLALNELSENKLISEIAWTGSIDHKKYFGAKADVVYSERKGHDNLFGDATSNVYPKIGSILMYKSKVIQGRLSGFYECNINKHFPIAAAPYVAYGSFKSSHTESGNKFKTVSYVVGALLQGSYINGRNMLKLSLDTAYRIADDTELTVSEDGYCNDDLFRTLAHTSQYFAKNEFNTKLSLRYQLQFKKKDVSCFIETSWMHSSYIKNQNADIITLTTGINL